MKQIIKLDRQATILTIIVNLMFSSLSSFCEIIPVSKQSI